MQENVNIKKTQKKENKYSYTSLKARNLLGPRLFEILVMLPDHARKKFHVQGEINARNMLNKEKARVLSCWCKFLSINNKPFPKLTESECITIFGKENVVGKSSRIRKEFKKKSRRNVFDLNIRKIYIGLRRPNGERTGTEFFIRDPKENWVDEIRLKLQNGERLIYCTCVTDDGIRHRLKDAEMIALLGEESVITKEENLKMRAQEKWEKHCTKNGMEIRPQ